MDDKFKVSCPHVSDAAARMFADQLESAIGEVANGERKPGRLPVEAMVRLIQFARQPKEAA
jgi:hypothetical protein